MSMVETRAHAEAVAAEKKAATSASTHDANVATQASTNAALEQSQGTTRQWKNGIIITSEKVLGFNVSISSKNLINNIISQPLHVINNNILYIRKSCIFPNAFSNITKFNIHGIKAIDKKRKSIIRLR